MNREGGRWPSRDH
jgi:hypothetical protein